jgi:alkylhydroperoxidase family enzyme
MPRIEPIDPAAASGHARELLNHVQGSLGRVPNLAATMAVEPRVLNAYLQFRPAITDDALTGAEREAIGLTVAGINGCSYCAAAHVRRA